MAINSTNKRRSVVGLLTYVLPPQPGTTVDTNWRMEVAWLYPEQAAAAPALTPTVAAAVSAGGGAIPLLRRLWPSVSIHDSEDGEEEFVILDL